MNHSKNRITLYPQIAFTEDSSEFSPSSHVSLKRSRSSSPSSSTCRVSRPVEDTLTTYDDLGLRDEDGTYHCLFCTKVFITMNEMRAHCKEDHNSKAFKCKICEGLFSNPRSLLMHTYTHTGEKPFKCTYCPLSFRQLSHRTGHIKKIHADDSPYPCEECSDRFASQNELNKHKKVSHVKRSDQNCHHCGKRYPTPGIMFLASSTKSVLNNARIMGYNLASKTKSMAYPVKQGEIVEDALLKELRPRTGQISHGEV